LGCVTAIVFAAFSEIPSELRDSFRRQLCVPTWSYASPSAQFSVLQTHTTAEQETHHA